MKTKFASIKKLFAARSDEYKKATKTILESMSGALNAIHEYMNIDEVEKRGGYLEWEEVSYVEDDGDTLVILLGVVGFPPGTEIVLEDEKKIKVTKDTAPYFRRIIRAGIPANIAQKSKKSVIAFLEKMEKESLNSNLDNVFSSEEDFDLSKLTDEQRRLYEASTATTSRKAS